MAGQECDILLIFPPIRTWDNPRNFPTGLGMIAAEVRQAGYKVSVVDANGLRLTDEQVLAEIEDRQPSVIGIGGLITTYSWVKRISGLIKEQWPDVPIILGGSVGTSIAETVLTRTAVDVITMGEADETILELLPALLNSEPLDNIAGLAFLKNGNVLYTAERELLQDVSSLPYPAWDLFPMDVYLENPVVGVGKDVDIISSRGCPFNCQYCYKIFGRKFRGRSAEHVVGEMEALKVNYDVDFVSFQDDCFVIDKERVYKICDLIDRSKILKGLRWSCNGRVTVCDSPLLQRMRASGCISVAYGIESGSQTILQNMQKHATLEQAAEAIRCSRDSGVRTPLAFMIGYPGETRETVMETVDFCKQLNIPLTSMTFTCPYPGTPLYKQLRSEGKLPGDEEELVVRMGDAVDLTVNLTEMSDEELIALRQEALDLARQNYTPPTPEQAAAHERELYGEELYRKAQEQLRNPRMRAHRQRHGFNEGQRGENEVAKAVISSKAKAPWALNPGKPYVIAEAGVNHNGDVSLALELVAAAKEAGADCVKFQAFSAEELVTKEAAKAEYQQNCGQAGESQCEMLKRYEFTRNAFAQIKQRCDELGIMFLATPFSTRWVDVLCELGVSAIKVGSGNIESGNLLDVIGQTGLPLIVSTGMSTLDEVDRTVARLRNAGSNELAVLHCVSLYPTRLDQVNLRAIATLQSHTQLTTGFSDHTCEIITGALAVAAGAQILEKHFTLDKAMDGPDHQASLEPNELREYITLAQQAMTARGSGDKGPLPEELPVKNLVRFSVVTAKFIKAGSVITQDMVTTKRPGIGISAEELELVIGAKALRDMEADVPVTHESITIK
ncbi:MAG: N-acetylneuraminate synthase family protein [Sedimentisphaerales bacterium]|nr:N-acetylneuraminate synthase family protein [Sedimentisphaerales bacterium]